MILRDDILRILEQTIPSPQRLNEIAKALNISTETSDYDLLKTELQMLVDDGTIYRSSRRRYGIEGATETSFDGVLSVSNFTGSVSTNSAVFPKINIKRPFLSTAIHGDTVRVKLLAFSKDQKPNGEIVEIIKRGQETICGKIEFDGDFYFLTPDDEKIHVDFLVHPSRLNGAKDGDKAVIRIVRWNDPFKSPEAEVVELLGTAGVAQVEYASILKEFRLKKEFDEKVNADAVKAVKNITKKEILRRLDLREETIITIDPVDARDFDDALSLKKLDNGNVLLGVHIADVSHYVSEGNNLDAEASRRATSVYLVDGVVPMLPEILSNDVCSLVPNKDRLTFSAMMEFSTEAKLVKYEIRESVINSKRRFTYEEAQNIIDGADDPLKDFIIDLHNLAKLLSKKRYKIGGVEFETTETKFLLDENKKPIKAVQKTRSDATSLVEECMLVANQTISEHIGHISSKPILPFIYRIHDEPDRDKLRAAIDLIRSLGITVSNEKPTSRFLNNILTEIKNLPEKYAIHNVLLRSMAKAIYSNYNIGHYGLGFAEYSHFTSPIRRYPDLIAHRLLKEYAKGIPSKTRIAEIEEYLEVMSEHCSIQERSATEAERASIKLTHATIARELLGQEFNGTVTGVTNFGLFVMIDEYFAEGLLKMRDLDDDYYLFNERQFMLVGKSTRKTFRLGTRLRIKIARVNLAKREIDFMYLGRAREAVSILQNESKQIQSEKPANSALSQNLFGKKSAFTKTKSKFAHEKSASSVLSQKKSGKKSTFTKNKSKFTPEKPTNSVLSQEKSVGKKIVAELKKNNVAPENSISSVLSQENPVGKIVTELKKKTVAPENPISSVLSQEKSTKKITKPVAKPTSTVKIASKKTEKTSKPKQSKTTNNK